MTEREPKPRPDWWPGQHRYEQELRQQQEYQDNMEWAHRILEADRVRQQEQARLDREWEAQQLESRERHERAVRQARANSSMGPTRPSTGFRLRRAPGPSSQQTDAAHKIQSTPPPREPVRPNSTDWIGFIIGFIPVAIIVGIWLGIVVWGMVVGWQMAAERDGAWYYYLVGMAIGGLFYGMLALVPVFIMGALCSVGEARR